jgi:Mn-dependent DtxR family transcriptional regulator
VLGLPASTADQDACGMEHALSEQTHERLVLFLEFLSFIESQPTGRDLIDAFRTFCRNDNDAQPTAKGSTESADSQRRGG